MGFRVNKRIRVAKGVSLNISKKGVSTSVKVGKTTINSRGKVTTNIAPGISHQTDLRRRAKPSRGVPGSLGPVQPMRYVSSGHDRDNYRSTRTRDSKATFLVLFSAGALLALIGVSMLVDGNIGLGFTCVVVGAAFAWIAVLRRRPAKD